MTNKITPGTIFEYIDEDKTCAKYKVVSVKRDVNCMYDAHTCVLISCNGVNSGCYSQEITLSYAWFFENKNRLSYKHPRSLKKLMEYING